MNSSEELKLIMVREVSLLRLYSIETLYRISVVLEKDMNSFFEENDYKKD